MPDSSYYPSKDAAIPICIVDSGYNGRTHPDLSNVVVTAADEKEFSDECWDSHGTVRDVYLARIGVTNQLC